MKPNKAILAALGFIIWAVLVAANTGPVISDVLITYSGRPRVDQYYVCAFNASDADLDDFTTYFNWTVNDRKFEEGYNLYRVHILNERGYRRDDVLKCTLTVMDTHGANATKTSPPVVLVNTPPTITALLLKPPSPTVMDDVQCRPETVVDIDDPSGPFTFQYGWQKNSSSMPFNTNWLPAYNVQRGDPLTCSAIPSDPLNEAGPITYTPISFIGNAGPVILNITARPVNTSLPASSASRFNASTLDPLLCSVFAAFDADNDTITHFSCHWYRNNVSLTVFNFTYGTDSQNEGALASLLLSPDQTEAGDVFHCGCWGYDLWDATIGPFTYVDAVMAGPQANSTYITIANTPPIVVSTRIDPLLPHSGNNLTCTVTEVYDPDSPITTAFTYSYLWTRTRGSTATVLNVTTNLLPKVHFRLNDTVSCQARANDGRTWGIYSSIQPYPGDGRNGTVIIGNQPPVIVGNVTILPDDWVSPTAITCSVANISDPDAAASDPWLSSTFDWYVNGTYVETSVMTASAAGGLPRTSAPFTTFARMDVVRCVATVQDMVNSSLPVNSSYSLVIDAPQVTSWVMADPNNRDLVFNPGHTITINFNAASTAPVFAFVPPETLPPVSSTTFPSVEFNTSMIFQLFTFSHSLGTSFSGQWLSNTQYRIVAEDVRGNNLQLGLSRVCASKQAAIRYRYADHSRISLVAGCVSGTTTGLGWSPTLTGNFGSIPTSSIFGVFPIASYSVPGGQQVLPSSIASAPLTQSCVGGGHALAIGEGGRAVYATGLNDHGQLGIPHHVLRAQLQALSSSGGTIYDLYRTAHTGFIRVTNLTEALDAHTGGDTSVVFTRVVCGASHSMVLASDGSVWVSGSNLYGQLGLGIAAGPETASDMFIRVPQPVHPSTSAPIKIDEIEAGDQSSFLLAYATTSSRSVWAAGRNFGQIYSSGSNNVFKLVSGFGGVGSTAVKIVQASAGADHVLFLSEMGDVYAWGRSSEGQLGLELAAASEQKPIVSLVPHSSTTSLQALLTREERSSFVNFAIAVGATTPTRISSFSTTSSPSTRPVSPQRVVMLASGSYHSIAVTADGTFWCWGRNSDGQCGIENADGSRSLLTRPTAQPRRLMGSSFPRLITGTRTMTSVTNFNGEVFVFGWDQAGILSSVNTTSTVFDSYVPTRIPSLSSTVFPSQFLVSTGVSDTSAFALSVTRSLSSSCPKDCSGHGGCYDLSQGDADGVVTGTSGVCVCAELWEGEDCSTPVCPKAYGLTCAGNGTCTLTADSSACNCNTNFTGIACTDPDCFLALNSCSGHGTCSFTSDGGSLMPMCTCAEHFTGPTCATCQPGWSGANCDVLDCSTLPTGACVNGGVCTANSTSGEVYCACTTGWTGPSCAVAACYGSPMCSGNGLCSVPLLGEFEEWRNRNQTLMRAVPPFNSTGGSLDVAICRCNDGWQGALCDEAIVCSLTCSGQGTCVLQNNRPVCQCNDGYSDEACATKSSRTNVGLIVGLVIGAILLLLLIAALAWWWHRYRSNPANQRKSRAWNQPPTTELPTTAGPTRGMHPGLFTDLKDLRPYQK